MKILHFADLHLGISPERDEIVLGCLGAAFDIAREEEVDYIVIPGDIFERALINTSKTSLSRLVEIFANYPTLHSGIPEAHTREIIIVRGTPSHDVEGSLDILKPFAAIIDEPFHLPQKDAFFICYPEPSKALAAGARSDEIGKVYAEAVRKELGSLKVPDGGNIPAIFVGHLAVAGSTTGSGWGLKAAISPAEILELTGADVAMLGDVHKAQIFVDGRVRYSGSICHLDFGDREPEKGCWLWEFEGRDIREVTWKPLPSRRMIAVTLKGMVKGFPEFPELEEPLPNTSGTEVWLRIPENLRDAPEVIKLIESIQGNAHDLKVEYTKQETPRELRSADIVKLDSLKDELAEWAKMNNIELPDTIWEKLANLEKEIALEN